jgi:mono/diheme cytochrome c family protein
MFRITISKKIATLLLAALFGLNLFAASWDVPADKKSKNSFIKFNDASSKEGEVLYNKNCASCHGNPSKGNVLKSLKPIPPDLASAGTQQLTDGELFYILNTGRGLMPTFKNVLSENDRWKVISYIRSFNKKYVQVLSNTDPSKSELVKVSMNYDSKTNKVSVKVVAKEKTGTIVLKDAEVLLFAKRYFGKLQLDKGAHTNNEGVACFEYAKDLPGDKTGNVELIAKVNDEKYGELESSSKFKIGIPTDKPALTEKRAIWNVLVKAPIWLIITYTSGVLVFVAFLLYLVFNLLDFWKKGKAKDSIQ